MLRRAARSAAVAGLLLLAAACGGSESRRDGSGTVTVGGDRVTVVHLLEANAGLCHARTVAATDPDAARADFYNVAHDALHSVARGLETVDRPLAADLLVSMQKVESGLETRPPGLADDVGRLGDLYRAGLRRLAIDATPCVE